MMGYDPELFMEAFDLPDPDFFEKNNNIEDDDIKYLIKETENEKL